jgi:hypothetical protein
MKSVTMTCTIALPDPKPFWEYGDAAFLEAVANVGSPLFKAWSDTAKVLYLQAGKAEAAREKDRKFFDNIGKAQEREEARMRKRTDVKVFHGIVPEPDNAEPAPSDPETDDFQAIDGYNPTPGAEADQDDFVMPDDFNT